MDDLLARDGAALWHPATHFDDLAVCPPIAIDSALGPWLYARDGRRILDAIASWWTCAHGHRHPAVVAAIHRQVDQLDHVMFAGFTHAPAVELAEGLLAAAGGAFARVYFADSGSDAVEVALKLCLQFHQQSGAPRRRRIAALEHGYHGETLGALAACGNDLYRAPFADLLHDAVFLPTPALAGHRHADLGTTAGTDDAALEAALAVLDEHAETLAAVIVEPLVQCAGQMRMHGSGYLARVVRHARDLGILVVADEIAVGLGRTGRMFAHHHGAVQVDAVCLGKALSGGTLPLSAVLTSPRFEPAFRGAPARAFAHSHTFCANPLATAAGAASLAVLLDSLGPAADHTIAALDAARARVAAACPAVITSRQAGSIVAFDLRPHTRRPSDGRIGLHLRAAALARGVLLRPLGDTLYWMPPLLLPDDAIALLADATIGAIEEVLG